MDLVRSHIGICVANIERSDRISHAGLGFEVVDWYMAASPEALLEPPEIQYMGTFFTRGANSSSIFLEFKPPDRHLARAPGR
jgi:hypothetical protein